MIQPKRITGKTITGNGNQATAGYSILHNQKLFHHTEWMQEIHSEGQSNKAVKDICTSQLEEQKREEEVVQFHGGGFKSGFIHNGT